MKHWVPTIAWLVSALTWRALAAELQVLQEGVAHLRSGEGPEWEEFASRQPNARRLDLPFQARTNTAEATLFIRQEDVRQDWFVELNGRRLGKLFLMEADVIHALALPAGSLRDGENRLSFIPPRDNDDILLHQIALDSRSRTAAISQAVLEVEITDARQRSRLPCRLTITDLHGTLVPVVPLASAAETALAVRPGVVYTGHGQARLGLRAGQYLVYASRGFEYSVATQRVHLAQGGADRLALSLRREVPTPGLVSCDPHVHTFTHSGHGDATMEERMVTLAGEGMELPVATDHNLHIDYSETARRLSVADQFTPMIGNEVTTAAGHFNIFPAENGARVPDFRITHWPTLMKSLRATPGVRVVQLNHPRNIHNGFQPFAETNFNAVTGENKRGPEFSFDAMEVLNSSAQQSDYLLVYRDWFALLNHGYRITATGSSDSHDVSRYIVGQGRTYVPCPDQTPGRLDVAAACSNLLAGRAWVSMGLLVDLVVNERFTVGDLATGLGEQLRVTARVLAPSWVAATNLVLFANGVKLRAEKLGNLPDTGLGRPEGEKATVQVIIPRPPHDVYLVALATGPGVTAPFWAIPRPYQPVSPRWAGRVIGSSNPIWVDGDGDGQFTSARGYAQQLLARHGGDEAMLREALAGFDEPVAAQVAALRGMGHLRFQHRYIARELPVTERGVGDYGLTALVDLDRDGDLDFVLGGRPSKTSRLYWFERQANDRWVQHLAGTNYLSDVGLAAQDVDQDGWTDLICSGVWFRNPGPPGAQTFERFIFDDRAAGAHDILMADIDRDGKLDVVMMGDERTQLKALCWYSVPADPRQPWPRYSIGPPVHGAITPAGAVDLDSDGDLDVLRADTWFENKDGQGREWLPHTNVPMGRKGPFGICVRTAVADLDGDGKAEVVIADADITDSKVVILKNADGKGGRWSKQELPRSFTYGSLHALAVADLSGDGRADIVANEQEELLPAGRENPRWVVWENLGESGFAERVILDTKLGGHELQVGDVDGDGDIDICSKPWGPRPWNGNAGNMHVDFLENLQKSTAARKP